MSPTKIHIAHSPDSDDAFMFHALANGKVDTGGFEFVHELRDIESLNQAAFEGKYEVSAVSFHAYCHLADRYAILPHGASFGDGYGPIVVSMEPLEPERLPEVEIAVPGLLTTSYLTFRLYLGGAEPRHRVVPFDRIMDEVKGGNVLAGLLIHEGQITYQDEGFRLIEDLGAWWKRETGDPLPLGCNVIRKDLGEETVREVSLLLRKSIEYALAHREEALDHAMVYARDLPREKADTFVGMYVNDWTRAYGVAGEGAVRTLLHRAAEAGLIPNRVEPEFVGS
ncbi:MAG: ABC transporter substrate-binding protein [Nitrospinota bacterium]|nr:ABC transporter substrate-binding protein [Nitrospinota bacterium]